MVKAKKDNKNMRQRTLSGLAAFRLGARERFLMGTNVNTPKLQVPTPEFGHGARARVHGLDLELGHYMVLRALEFPVSEHNTAFHNQLTYQNYM